MGRPRPARTALRLSSARTTVSAWERAGSPGLTNDLVRFLQFLPSTQESEGALAPMGRGLQTTSGM
jgi:hypothetical protein